MPTDDAAELKKLEAMCREMLALAEKASDGWHLDHSDDYDYARILTQAGRTVCVATEENGDDLALIAAARTALPTLARELLSRLAEAPKVRWTPYLGPMDEDERDRIQRHLLFQYGDTILVWANEGDLCWHEQLPPERRHG